MLAIALVGGFGSATAVGTYLWSLRVASVKAHTAAVDGQIAETRDQIGRLRMELVLRTRLAQQKWWAPALGLTTPDPRQYGRSGDELPAIAEARRVNLANDQAVPPLLVPAAAAPASMVGRAEAPGVARVALPQKGYAPQARHALDTLIADIGR